MLLILLVPTSNGGGSGHPARATAGSKPNSAINNHTEGDQHSPQVRATAEGFFVGWQSHGDRRDGATFGRRLDAVGRPLTGEIGASLPPIDRQRAKLADGVRKVEIEERYGIDGNGWGLVFQLYDETGAALGGPEPVNLYSQGHQEQPMVVALADGGFFVVWQSDGQDGEGWGVFGRRFDSAGRGGAEIQLNVHTVGDQKAPSVATLDTWMAGGEQVYVVWQSDGQDGDGLGVFGRNLADLIFADGFEVGGLDTWGSFTMGLRARFIASPRFGFAALPVSFDARSTLASSDTTVTYHWDFGDGTTGSGATPGHVYAAGNYQVSLTATDTSGATSVATTTVSVLEAGQAHALAFTVQNSIVPGLENGEAVAPAFTVHNQALPQQTAGRAEAPYFTLENQGGS